MDREPCPTDEALLALMDGDGRLGKETAAATKAHLDRCPPCRRLLAALARSRHHEAAPPEVPKDLARVRTLPSPEAPQRPDDEWIPPPQFDDYQIIGPLGQGQMGQVFSAHDVQLDRPVAIKFLREQAAQGQGYERLRNEARAIARLRHPGVVQVHRFGEVQGRPYLVTELLVGESLDRHLKQKGRMPWQHVLELGLRLAEALAAAHAEGVLHRDIKPGNIFLTEEGEPKLLDFGLAKLAHSGEAPRILQGDGPPTLTQTGMLLGTPLYMAPELWRGEPATPRSDVYALGGLLFEMCAGHPPHRADSLVLLSTLVTGQDATPLRQAAPGVDEGLATVVDRCLRRDPEGRHPSAAALLAALQRRAWEIASRRRRLGLTLLLGAAACVPIGMYAVSALRGLPGPDVLVALPGGEFTMGSTPSEALAALEACRRDSAKPEEDCKKDILDREVPARKVRVAPFSIQATEVTLAALADWLQGLADQGRLEVRSDPDDTQEPRWVWQDGARLVDLFGSYKPIFGMKVSEASGRLRFQVLPGHERRPAAHVTWTGAARYCRDHGMRLPTEAEWEHAARGAAGRRFPWGFDEPRCDSVVFDRVKRGKCEALVAELAPVATSPQDVTPEGVYDLGGNVGEWVLDQFTGPYAPCPQGICVDPLDGPADPDARPAERARNRVNRGGRLRLDWTVSRSASRIRYPENNAFTDIGFRCVKPTR